MIRTEILRVDPSAPDVAAVRRAAEILERGGLVALPTETVYGLAARADNASAAERIFEAKGRPATNPLIVHVPDLDSARAFASDIPLVAEQLARAVWPGPLTLVVPRDASRIPDVVTGGGPTVALRVPAHPVMLAVLRALGRPLAAPSANRFQALSPTTAAHVASGLDGRVELILDAGPSAHGLESTVVDTTTSPPTLLRPGPLSIARIRAIIGDCRVADVRADDHEGPLRSPGLVRRHYAPRTRLVVVRPELLEEALVSLGPEVGVLTRDGRTLAAPVAAHVALPDEPNGFGAALYATLHRLDEGGHACLVVEAVPDDDAWAAVRDRLARASD